MIIGILVLVIVSASLYVNKNSSQHSSRNLYFDELNKGFSAAEKSFRDKDIIQSVASASSYDDHEKSRIVKFRFLVQQGIDQQQANELVKEFIGVAQYNSRLDRDVLTITDIVFDILDSDGNVLFDGHKKKDE
jgi:uncharacterized protein YxeA